MVNDVKPYEDFSATQIPLRNLNGDTAVRATFVSYNTNISKISFMTANLTKTLE